MNGHLRRGRRSSLHRPTRPSTGADAGDRGFLPGAAETGTPTPRRPRSVAGCSPAGARPFLVAAHKRIAEPLPRTLARMIASAGHTSLSPPLSKDRSGANSLFAGRMGRQDRVAEVSALLSGANAFGYLLPRPIALPPNWFGRAFFFPAARLVVVWATDRRGSKEADRRTLSTCARGIPLVAGKPIF